MSQRHRLVDDCVRVVRDKDGKPQGITAECTCGWKSGGHFSGMGASAAFMDHQEQAEKQQEDER